MHTEKRLHPLDAVRAFALISAIVLHATMTFMPGLTSAGFPADSSQSPELQILFYVIHVFRMSLFFFIAGFFAHLMFHRKGAAGFLRDRAKRILVPLLVGWVLFGPLAMGLVYIGLGASRAGGAAAAAAERISATASLVFVLLAAALCRDAGPEELLRKTSRWTGQAARAHRQLGARGGPRVRGAGAARRT